MRRPSLPAVPAAPAALDPWGFAALIDAHLAQLAARNYSRETVKNRRSHLGHFRRWCEERGLVRPRELSAPILERYREALAQQRKADGARLAWSSQSERLIAVKVFLRSLVRDRTLLYNPAAELELPKKPKRLPREVLTIAEVEQVLAQPDLATPLGLRDRALLEVLYSTGIRRLELIHLELADVDRERGTLFVREGKGQKDRVVPIGDRALAWLDKYLVEVRPRLARGREVPTVFLSTRGGPLAPNRLTERCHRYVRVAGVRAEGSCHLFRHTAATLMLEAGADLRFIQQMLGHERLSSTEVYTRVSIRQLKEVHSRTHPARLMRGGRAGEAEREVQQLALATAVDEEIARDEDADSESQCEPRPSELADESIVN